MRCATASPWITKNLTAYGTLFKFLSTNIFTSTNLSHDQHLVECRHQVSASAVVDYELFFLSYTPTHILHSSQTCCRCLHSRHSRTPHSDLMNLRTSRVERSPHTDLSLSPAVNICLQQYNTNEIICHQHPICSIMPVSFLIVKLLCSLNLVIYIQIFVRQGRYGINRLDIL